MKHLFLLFAFFFTAYQSPSTAVPTKSTPPPETISPEEKTDPSTKAPHKITKYFDFGCGYCRQGAQNIKALKAKYGDQLETEFIHLLVHPQVVKVHQAAECAREQKKFEQFFYSYFEDHYGAVSTAGLEQVATSLDLDIPRYQSCMESDHGLLRIQQETQLGHLLGISGTPYFIINDQKHLPGFRSLSDLEKAITQP